MGLIATIALFALASCNDGETTAPPPSPTPPLSQTPPSPRPTPGEDRTPTSVETTPPSADDLLTLGDEGGRVRRLQKRLRRLGYDVPRNGTFGERTEEALRSFQQDVGIPADGGFGQEERRALREALDEQEDEQEEERQEPEAETSPDLLENGDRGDEVLELQRRLESLRYWVGPKDGVYGTLTEQAVLAFQGVEGLSRDGVVGPETRFALEDASVPQPRGSGDLIEINEVAQVIYIVRDGSARWTFHTSTGTEESYQHPDGNTYLADTPNGRWTFGWEVDGWRDGRLGRMWRPKYFHEDGIAIHGYQSVPAYPASHGCARVTIEAMNFIWERGLAPMGSTVLVYGRG